MAADLKYVEAQNVSAQVSLTNKIVEKSTLPVRTVKKLKKFYLQKTKK